MLIQNPGFDGMNQLFLMVYPVETVHHQKTEKEGNGGTVSNFLDFD